jgi:ArsR family transcriptional regulator, arsenate/arsenite/antimonite-responsive transcriptional repressor
MAKPKKQKPLTLVDVKKSFRARSELFHALGDHFRQDIVLLLAARERLNVNEITEHIALSRPAVSHHLKVLLRANLLRISIL